MRIRRCITALAGAIALSVLAAMPSLAAGWQLDSTGYWYEREDRSYPADTWEQIGGTWYLFDQDGYMLTGWQQREGVWYYLGTDGAMVSNTTMTIDNVSYTFDSSGAMAAQTAGPPLMGRFDGPTFINEWSNIRLTVPQGFINYDSSALSQSQGPDTFLDMLSMKNENCAVMLLYTSNKEGNAADQAMAFLNMFQGGSHTLDEGGRIEAVQAGSLEFLRFYFPPTQSNPLSGYLYVRNIGEYYAVLAAVSDPAGEPDIQAVLSTLSQAR